MGYGAAVLIRPDGTYGTIQLETSLVEQPKRTREVILPAAIEWQLGAENGPHPFREVAILRDHNLIGYILEDAATNRSPHDANRRASFVLHALDYCAVPIYGDLVICGRDTENAPRRLTNCELLGVLVACAAATATPETRHLDYSLPRQRHGTAVLVRPNGSYQTIQLRRGIIQLPVGSKGYERHNVILPTAIERQLGASMGPRPFREVAVGPIFTSHSEPPRYHNLIGYMLEDAAIRPFDYPLNEKGINVLHDLGWHENYAIYWDSPVCGELIICGCISENTPRALTNSELIDVLTKCTAKLSRDLRYLNQHLAFQKERAAREFTGLQKLANLKKNSPL